MKHNGIEDERSYLKLMKLQNALIVPDTDFNKDAKGFLQNLRMQKN